jgi:hypothetical protein
LVTEVNAQPGIFTTRFIDLLAGSSDARVSRVNAIPAAKRSGEG